MAASPQNQETQINSKPEDDDATKRLNNNKNDGNKDPCETIPSTDIESSDPNQHSSVSSSNTIACDEHRSDPISPTPITNEVDLATSPQNTVGLPCGDNRNEVPIVATRERARGTSIFAPPALPPRPANLQAPIVVNGLPHPPHAFNISQGKFCLRIK